MSHPAPGAGGRAPVRRAALAVGALFLLLSVMGFLPGVTANYSELRFAGREPEARLLGVFEASILLNLVHAALGAAGLAMASTVRRARHFLIGGGVFYLALWLFGLLVRTDDSIDFVPLHTADDWLRFLLGIAMAALGTLLPTRPRPTSGTLG